MNTRLEAASDALRTTTKETLSIPLRALGLLLGHLPQLITVICLGLAGRQAVIWLAVWISQFSSLAATLVMPLAPACVMISLIFCLWLLRPSLPFLAATFPARAETSRLRLLSVGGLLVSFLTVYSTHGMLKEDLIAFRRATTIDEVINQGFQADYSRAFVDNTGALIGLIVVTIIIRKIIGTVALKEERLGLTYLSAYLEILWMSTVSVVINNGISNAREWGLSRQGIAPAYRSYLSARSDISSGVENTTGPLVDAWNWLATTLPSFNQLITVPIAWLTLGAVVFGTSIAAKTAAEATAAAQEEEIGVRRRLTRAAKHQTKLAVDNALKPVAGPLKTTWSGLRTLARAGLFPMVLFCLIFIFASAVELGTVALGRWILGPQELLRGEALASYVMVTARAAYLLVVITLVAAALDFFLRSTYSPEVSGSEMSDSEVSESELGSEVNEPAAAPNPAPAKDASCSSERNSSGSGSGSET